MYVCVYVCRKSASQFWVDTLISVTNSYLHANTETKRCYTTADL